MIVRGGYTIVCVCANFMSMVYKYVLDSGMDMLDKIDSYEILQEIFERDVKFGFNKVINTIEKWNIIFF